MADQSTVNNLRTGMRLIREGRQWLGVAASGDIEKPARGGIEKAIHRSGDILDRLEALAEGMERNLSD